MQITKTEVEEAVRVFESSINKCEKAQMKLKEGSWQRENVQKQLAAFNISVSFLKDSDRAKLYSGAELMEAVRTLKSLIGKIEGMECKFKEETPQKTLLDRRLKAFGIAASLIEIRL